MGKYDKYKRFWTKELLEEELSKKVDDKSLREVTRKARSAAFECAQVLVKKYKVQKVYLIGSLTKGGTFHQGSDIDLVVKGLRPS